MTYMKWLGQCTCNSNKKLLAKSRNHTVNKLFCLCIPTDGELSNRLLLSLHCIIASSIYPSLNIFVTVHKVRILEKKNLKKWNLSSITISRISTWHKTSSTVMLSCIQEPPLNSTYTQFQNLSEKQGQAAATVCITDGMYSKTECKAALNEKKNWQSFTPAFLTPQSQRCHLRKSFLWCS